MDQNLRRQAGDGLSFRLERMKPVRYAFKPRVVGTRMVRNSTFDDVEGDGVAQCGIGARVGEEATEREGKDIGDFSGVQLGLWGEKRVVSGQGGRERGRKRPLTNSRPRRPQLA
jgi:hypothetical protein